MKVSDDELLIGESEYEMGERVHGLGLEVGTSAGESERSTVLLNELA